MPSRRYLFFLKPRPGESRDAFKQRVRRELKATGVFGPDDKLAPAILPKASPGLPSGSNKTRD